MLGSQSTPHPPPTMGRVWLEAATLAHTKVRCRKLKNPLGPRKKSTLCIRICIHVCNAHGKISFPISSSAEPSIANLHSVNCTSLRNSSRQSTTARCECPDASASPASSSLAHARGGGLYFACPALSRPWGFPSVIVGINI